MATRLPFVGQRARLEGPRVLRRPDASTPAAGRTSASTSPASASPSSAPARPPSRPSRCIAAEAAHLFVFQRTPNYSIPAQNHPLPRRRCNAGSKPSIPPIRAARRPDAVRLRHPTEREVRPRGHAKRSAAPSTRRAGPRAACRSSSAFADILYSREANDTAAEFIRGKIRGLVRDPEVAEMLSPQSVVGCKRLCSDTELLRDLQPSERDARRPPQHADRGGPAARPPDQGRASTRSTASSSRPASTP